jgi:hypothetical protein
MEKIFHEERIVLSTNGAETTRHLNAFTYLKLYTKISLT